MLNIVRWISRQVTAFERALEVAPDDPDTTKSITLALSALPQRYAEARHHLDRAKALGVPIDDKMRNAEARISRDL